MRTFHWYAIISNDLFVIRESGKIAHSDNAEGRKHRLYVYLGIISSEQQIPTFRRVHIVPALKGKL